MELKIGAANIVSNLSNSERIQPGVVHGYTKTGLAHRHARSHTRVHVAPSVYGRATLPCLCINKMAHKTLRR